VPFQDSIRARTTPLLLAYSPRPYTTWPRNRTRRRKTPRRGSARDDRPGDAVPGLDQGPTESAAAAAGAVAVVAHGDTRPGRGTRHAGKAAVLPWRRARHDRPGDAVPGLDQGATGIVAHSDTRLGRKAEHTVEGAFVRDDDRARHNRPSGAVPRLDQGPTEAGAAAVARIHRKIRRSGLSHAQASAKSAFRSGRMAVTKPSQAPERKALFDARIFSHPRPDPGGLR